MPTPPECQPIEQEIANLKAQQQALKTKAEPLAGNEKWNALNNIAQIGMQIAAKEDELSNCIEQQADRYVVDLVVYDLAGTATTPLEARLSQISPTGEATLEAQNVAENHVSFSINPTATGGSIGLSIREASTSGVPGFLFRSGPYKTLPPSTTGSPGGPIEIGVFEQPIIISAGKLKEALVSIPLPLVFNISLPSNLPAVPGLAIENPLPVTVTALTATLGTGSLTATAHATAPFGTFGEGIVDFTISVGITPSSSIGDTAEICVVTPIGSGTLTRSGALSTGILGTIAGLLSGSMLSSITTKVVSVAQGMLNQAMLLAAGEIFGLNALPEGAVLSMRRVVITPDGVSFYPAFGAFGGLLSKILP